MSRYQCIIKLYIYIKSDTRYYEESIDCPTNLSPLSMWCFAFKCNSFESQLLNFSGYGFPMLINKCVSIQLFLFPSKRRFLALSAQLKLYIQVLWFQLNLKCVFYNSYLLVPFLRANNSSKSKCVMCLVMY